jgi:hypothetical protein
MSAKPIEVARIANEWMVGNNVGRVVPVYSLHNVVAPDFSKDGRMQSIKHLIFDADMALAELGSVVNVGSDDFDDLQETVRGLLSPESRVFRDNKKGGAAEQGALFPIIGGLTAPTGSDDGLGKRIRSLLERHQSNWQKQLELLMQPQSIDDPATAFAAKLVGDRLDHANPRGLQGGNNPLQGIDLACARFIDNLLDLRKDDNRIPAIRRLAIGIFFTALIRLVSGVVTDTGKSLPSVFVFCGLPPGGPFDPLVRAASKSFTAWIQASHTAMVKNLFSVLSAAASLPGADKDEKLRQKLRTALNDRRLAQRAIDAIITTVEGTFDGQGLTEEWCKRVLESKALGLKKAELARRVRSLGANIGFAGPDRGTLPRLMVDTPLLGVLARGIVGSGSMPFEEFITVLHEQFGLVLGIGTDDSVADRIGDVGFEGLDPYELLQRNQEILRERMIRTGLARMYSDSHTEVFGNV